MATLATQTTNGSNGVNGLTPEITYVSKRFTDIPQALDIPVQGQGLDEDDQAVEVDLEELLDDPTELCTLLENEKAARTFWMTVSLAYAKQKKSDHAIEMLTKGLQVVQGGPKEKLSMLTCLCWLYLWKSRESPRVAAEGTLVSEARTKEHYLQIATSTLNDASRINPAFPPLFLARGVLYLLRASLQPPAKAANPNLIDPEKADILRHALKSFEDALRVSHGRNIMAVLGKSRALFSMGKYAEALEGYQEALHKMPDLVDPDPRIGVGCCFWQLNYKDDAKSAWERALEINPKSKIANILLGLYYLDASGHVPTNGKTFIELYKKAMTEYTQNAFKADKDLPLTCATFAGYFLSRKSLENTNTLAHKAIQFTDVNAIASDGWYLLARKEHYSDNTERANDYYRRADEARGGIDRGYLPAKFGAAQLSVLKGDFGDAKLRLEKIIQQSKNVEAMTLLGTIYAEEVFANQYAATKEDKTTESKKAIGLLESVRTAWKDTKKHIIPDASVVLNLARLYETDQPDKSLQCLAQVEQIEYDSIREEDRPKDPESDAQLRAKLRENLPPQLLNNMGCFQYQTEKFDQSRETFQAALNACVCVGERQEEMDTDALVTTISFNLGRTYEASGLLDEAKTVYEGLLARHADYTDARTRLAYIALRQDPTGEGPRAVSRLYGETSNDLEVRALYGWYLGKVHSRKRAANIAEDPELRHYKHTLQNYEKHDRYALIGMGNLYLQTAREMRRDTESDKAKRSQMYSKSVEFFDKALQLDPQNAYAAQGIAIAMVEDKKDFKNALSIFMKVRDTVRDPNVYVNLGHIFAELRQYSKSIEHYEMALARDRSHDAQIMACLGRTWLAKARAEKSLAAYKSALDYSQKALEIAPEQTHFKFNVAFVQIQLASTIHALSEAQRTLVEVESAAAGLEDAIESLEAIAKHPQTPYPKNLVEGRANMARNTMRKQLERSIQAQKEYEEKNAEKLQAAQEARQAELKKREEARLAVEAIETERKRKIAEERAEILGKDRELAELRDAEFRAREEAEMTEDPETGERVKRAKKPKSRRRVEAGSDDENFVADAKPKRSRKKERGAGSGDEESGEDGAPKKKRRLASKKDSLKRGSSKKDAAIKKDGAKYKSAEKVVDSDDEEDNMPDLPGSGDEEKEGTDTEPVAAGGDSDDDDDDAPVPVKRQARNRRIESDDEEDEDEGDGAAAPEQVENGGTPEPIAPTNGTGELDTDMADVPNEKMVESDDD